MTEQISHKRSLRVSRLNKDRQLLLSKYKPENNVSINDVNDSVSNVNSIDDSTDLKKSSTDDLSNNNNNDDNNNEIEQEEKPSGQTFKELIQIHNKLLGKEQETNNLIKSTIYDNYYDLIRVNDCLEDIIDPNSDINILWDKLKQNINT